MWPILTDEQGYRFFRGDELQGWTSRGRTGPGISHTALVADDDAVCRQFCAEVLTALNYSVIPAVDAASALLQALGTHPRLILMDLHLPDMDACETIRQMLSRWPDASAGCGLIGMTADDSPAALQGMYSAGFQRVLIKPFPAAALLAEVQFIGHRPASSRQEPEPLSADRLQRAFLAELPGQMVALDAALAATDWSGCGAILHRLCGSAAMARLTDFASLGRELAHCLQRPDEPFQLAQTYLDFLQGAKELLDGSAWAGAGFRLCE
jgi:CheY-like chemotaxis protein